MGSQCWFELARGLSSRGFELLGVNCTLKVNVLPNQVKNVFATLSCVPMSTSGDMFCVFVCSFVDGKFTLFISFPASLPN